MRPIQIACQLSFYPLGCETYSREIEAVLALIETSGLKATVGSMSTVINGEHEAVLALVANIIELQAESSVQFAMNLSVSNVCGCL